MARLSIEKTKGKVYTLAELCSLKTVDGNEHPSHVIHPLSEDKALGQAVSAHLASLGFRRFSYFGAGAFALVLSTVEGQLVRLSLSKKESQRPSHPAILQPQYTAFVRNRGKPTVRIEVFPEVKTEGITIAEIDALSKILWQDGIFPCDIYTHGNVGRLPGGQLVALDAGQFMTYSAGKMGVDDLKQGGWIDAQGEWAQHHCFPQIKQHRITGTAPQKILERLEAKRGKGSLVVQALADGFYPSEAGQLFIDAAAHEGKKASGGFREHFRQERQRRLKGHLGPDTPSPQIR